MASFHACPRELTDSILEQVSTCDLAALSLTSKKLHAAATPLLYSRINFSIYRDNPRPLIHLCRSIFQNPELAIYIKSVRLRDGEPEIQKLFQHPYNHQSRTPKASPPQPTDEDGLPEFVSFIAGSGLSYADFWIEKLRVGDLNACVALLLSKLPKLTTFRVGYAVALADLEGLEYGRKPPETAGESQFLGKIFQSAAFDKSNHGISRFQHLQDVFFPGPLENDPGRNPEFSNPRDVMALLSLPSIRSLSGWCLNPSSFPFTWPAGPPNLSHLTSLSMSFVHVDFLAQILERTLNLKKLSWEWKYIADIDPLNTDTIDLDRFVEAIKPCQDTLEDLTIDCINTVAWDDYERRYINLRGSLHGLDRFANIKRFKAPFTLLLPDWDDEPKESTRLEDSMPPNVEVVTVTDEDWVPEYPYDRESEMAKLRAWITETAATRTPKLVEICFYLTLASDWVRYEKYEDFERVFEGSRLRHRIIKAKDEEPWNDV
ncbi:hypothetical protein DPSP01_012487 [Paraphaeosphaeria sporulosa]|uniref:F-box domain-containing protein n=1 Tax=Paraphaeosphaeria sporulosa TaxID=1460663 RepID=A0A177CJL7_9PLEO|nr:uncharacterized protein CC84DRAFT_707917 [Paraphaeosphaeria sporulosa]OAG07715.1 hypothetical protein CC84DRAFT_707917 [Paraphaeosphaeria sporulosa]